MREVEPVEERPEIQIGSLSWLALRAMFMRGDKKRKRPALPKVEAENFTWAQEQLAREDLQKLKAIKAEMELRRILRMEIDDA